MLFWAVAAAMALMLAGAFVAAFVIAVLQTKNTAQQIHTNTALAAAQEAAETAAQETYWKTRTAERQRHSHERYVGPQLLNYQSRSTRRAQRKRR